MNYQQTKTIQTYSINKNLLLIGLLAFAVLAQGCTGGKKGTHKGTNAAGVSPALSALLGDLGGMSAQQFLEKVGQDAKECGGKLTKIELNGRTVETLKLCKECEICDEENKKTKKVNYFEALSCKLVPGEGKLAKLTKQAKVVENEAISGLFKTVLSKFSDDNKNKNAKIFVLYQLLVLKEKGDVTAFKQEMDKVKDDACGVLVQINAEGKVDFISLTSEDKQALTPKIGKGNSEKYILSEKLAKFVQDEVVKPIEKA